MKPAFYEANEELADPPKGSTHYGPFRARFGVNSGCTLSMTDGGAPTRTMTVPNEATCSGSVGVPMCKTQ